MAATISFDTAGIHPINFIKFNKDDNLLTSKNITLYALRVISIKFLRVISILCKTEWSLELGTWSHKMNLLNALSTPPCSFCRKWMGQQMRISILTLGCKRLSNPNLNDILKLWGCLHSSKHGETIRACVHMSGTICETLHPQYQSVC